MEYTKNIVVIGGGTGTYVVLSGLKQFPLVNISAIITMMDSGGSTGRLRDQYGVLPPGDVRQALVALSESDRVWRDLFLYRFEKGDLNGHNFGNLFLTALEKITGSFEEGLSLAQQILQTKGAIIPVTLQKTHIAAELTDGRIIETEALIDEREKRAPIKKLFIQKNVDVNPKALSTLSSSDYIIVGPGDLYTSVLPNFVFSKLKEEYQNCKAKKILVVNLMNKKGQTDDFKVSNWIEQYQNYLGTHPFDYVLINTTKIPAPILNYYLKFGENQVEDDLPKINDFEVLRGDFLSDIPFTKSESDQLERSVIRHDGVKIANYLWNNVINRIPQN